MNHFDHKAHAKNLRSFGSALRDIAAVDISDTERDADASVAAWFRLVDGSEGWFMEADFGRYTHVYRVGFVTSEGVSVYTNIEMTTTIVRVGDLVSEFTTPFEFLELVRSEALDPDPSRPVLEVGEEY
jgi:hypothetical protein